MRPRSHRLRQRLASPLITFAMITGAVIPAPYAGKMPDADKRILAEMALQWAVSGGLSDVHLLKDPSHVIVSEANLPQNVTLRLRDRTVTVLSPKDIQQRADGEGDFLYFKFGSFHHAKQRASVGLSLVWAVAATSTTAYLSGGGATLEFQKRDRRWELLPVANQWIS